MDIKTGLSIYNKQWLIEPSAAMQMLDFWESVKSGSAQWSYQKAKGENSEFSTYNLYQKFFASSNVVMAPDNSWDMKDFKGFDGATIAVIPVSGPLMKSDFCGSFGTQTLKSLTQMASATNSVKTILFVHDSGGGTVDGTKSFADTIKASPKQTISFVDGMMGSADYWIGSASDKIIASSETDEIGCIGTMCALVDNTEQLKSKGIILREYFASGSKDKNKAITDAYLGDGKALIQEMLDPINDVFLNEVRKNRGKKLNEEALSGKMYIGSAAKEMGLIDGIQSFEDVVSGVMQSHSKNSNSIYVNKSKKMTAAEFKQENPSAYAEIFNAGSDAGYAKGKTEGIAAEQDRVEGWQVWKEYDAEGVAEGIASGKEVNQKDISKFSVKALNKANLKQAESDNAAAITTGAAPKTEAEEADKELEANTARVLASMNIKK